MSKFFGASDSESESSSSEDDGFMQPKSAVHKTAFLPSSEDEDDVKRVVRSEREKRYEGLTNAIKALKNHKKIRDMAKCLDAFEELCKAYTKSKKVVEAEGIPKFFIKALAELEDFVTEVWEDRDWRKQTSKLNSKGLSNLRQKLRKYVKEHFETRVAEYRENPDAEDEQPSDEDEPAAAKAASPVAAAVEPPPEPKKRKEPKVLKDYDDSGDDFFDSDTDSVSSLSSDDVVGASNIAHMFLKKVHADKPVIKKVDKEKKKPGKEVKEVRESDDEGEWQEVKGFKQERPKLFAKDVEITHEVVLNKLREIVAGRGKKTTDRQDQIEMLIELLGYTKDSNLGPACDVKVMFNIVAAIFDYNPNISACMKPEMLEKCLFHITEILKLLREHPDIQTGDTITDEEENVHNVEEAMKVQGCLLTLTQRFFEEFIKVLQAADAHSTEYIDRLKDEPQVLKLVLDVEDFYQHVRASKEMEMCRIYLLHVQMIYYKVNEDSRADVQRMCMFVYKNDQSDRLRARAVLFHIYHHAIHDRWYEARDLMLMSHMQDTIQHSDISLQIQYNRAMVQLGLCAFRAGNIRDAHNCLVDIQSSGEKKKELLAQGLAMQRQQQRSPEDEKKERQRLMPYHMHINSEMLECVYLVSAMLSEIPYMAAHETDARRRMISKNFHYVLRQSEKQYLNGPPEKMQEHIVAASKAMKLGDWRECNRFVMNEKMNAKIWNLFHDPEKVKGMITGKIKEESLRTYLLSYSSVYDSLSLVQLTEMFELERPKVHSIVSKMIINDELAASLDEPSNCVVMHRTEPSRVQVISLQLADKVSSLLEGNEKLLDMKQGNFFQRGRDGQDQQQQGGQTGGQRVITIDRRQSNRGRGGGGHRGGRGGGYGGRQQHQNWGGGQNWRGNRY